MSDALALAQHLTARGFATIPIIGGTKRAACAWKRYQNVGPAETQIPALFNRTDLEVGIMCGAASDRLLVLDCDSDAMLTRVRDSLGDPPTWIVRGYRGAHVYLRTPVPVQSTRLDDLCVRAQREYVLAPGSRHPRGMTYQFVREAASIHELSNLDAIPWLPLKPAPADTKFQRPADMPLLAWQVLRGFVTPTTHPQYKTRSECEAAAVTALINAHWTFERVLDVFQRFAHADTKFKTKPDQLLADEWLRLTFDECGEFARTHQSATARAIQEMREWALARAWTGHTGAYKRAVYLAHLELAGRAVKIIYGAAVRDLAERALVSTGAVSHANQRLVQDGLISVKIPAVFTFATVWTLERAFVPKLNTPYPHNVEEVFNFGTKHGENAHFAAETAHDVFHWQGLGKSAAQVWGFLSNEQWQSAGSIALRTGRGKTTVWRSLSRMFDLGMVERRGVGNATEWRRIADVDLHHIGIVLGVAGKGSAQKKRHAQERTAHAARLQERGQPRLFGGEETE